MSDLPPLTDDMREHMARVVRSRAKGWREISRATAAVSEDFVTDLRDGTWISRILDSMAWTNEGGERLVATARTILPFERGAASRSLTSDVVVARVITAFLALESGRNLTDPLP